MEKRKYTWNAAGLKTIPRHSKWLRLTSKLKLKLRRYPRYLQENFTSFLPVHQSFPFFLCFTIWRTPIARWVAGWSWMVCWLFCFFSAELALSVRQRRRRRTIIVANGIYLEFVQWDIMFQFSSWERRQIYIENSHCIQTYCYVSWLYLDQLNVKWLTNLWFWILFCMCIFSGIIDHGNSVESVYGYLIGIYMDSFRWEVGLTGCWLVGWLKINSIHARPGIIENLWSEWGFGEKFLLLTNSTPMPWPICVGSDSPINLAFA